MARRILDVGDFANDGTGDSIRVAAIKLNETLAEVYNYFGNGSVLTFGTLTSSTSGNTVLGGDSFRVVGNTGQVSIGTANPTVLFQVSSVSGITSYTDQTSDVFKIEGNTDQGINISTGDSSNGYIAFSNTSTRAAGALGYDQGLNSLTIFTDNNERLRVDGSGNVGIGTASPLGRLHVENAAASAGWIVRGQTTSVSNESGLYVDASNNMELVARNGSGVLTALINSSGDSYFNGGNVGIGTNSPQDKIHISASSPRIRLTDTDTGVDHRINADSSAGSLIFDVDIHSEASGPGILYYIQGSEKVRITSGGNVGIGVTSPSQKLEVLGNAMLKGVSTESRFLEIGSERTGAGNSYLDFVADTTYSDYGLRIIRLGGSGGANAPSQIRHRGTSVLSLVAEDAGGKVTFLTNNTERMRVDQDGNVGIGTTSPNFKLDVHGSALGQTSGDTSDLLQIYSSVTNASYLNFQMIRTANGAQWHSAGTRIQQVTDVTKQGYIQFNGDGNDYGISFGSNNIERMRIDASGNVGIGITSPSYKLDVAGTIHSSTGGFRFPDGSTQTTAGLEVPNGKSIAFALIFG